MDIKAILVKIYWAFICTKLHLKGYKWLLGHSIVNRNVKSLYSAFRRVGLKSYEHNQARCYHLSILPRYFSGCDSINASVQFNAAVGLKKKNGRSLPRHTIWKGLRTWRTSRCVSWDKLRNVIPAGRFVLCTWPTQLFKTALLCSP